MIKRIADAAIYWVYSLIAIMWTNTLNVLPYVREMLTILSILIAIGFSSYRFFFGNKWIGFFPWRHKRGKQ